MLADVLAEAPQWVVDAKNYLGFGASLVAAFGLVWKYAIKPYLEHRETERKRDLADAAAVRRSEILAALTPLQDQVAKQQHDVSRFADKLVLLGDAMSGANRRIDDVNNRLDKLHVEQEALHTDLRKHMEAEDMKGRTT